MRIRWLLPLALLLTACPPERDCDADRDGFDSDAERCGGDDCNDATYLVNPDAPEICDGLDNNCDGQADLPEPANPPTWYADGDGDGYGDPDVTEADCTAPDGYVNNGLDCDDGRTLVRPGAIETCDGQDNDCDGEVDEDDAQFAPDWWRDGDGDGFGNPTSAVITACNAPDGYANDNTDCDDSEADVHPGADDPCDGRDSNCDGIIEFIWFADTDGDGFGDASSAVDSCDPGAGWTQDSGDCNDGRNDVYPGAPEVCGDGVENNCDGVAEGCGIAGTIDVDALAANMVRGGDIGHGFGYRLVLGDVADPGVGGVFVDSYMHNESFLFLDPLEAGPDAADADAIMGTPAPTWFGGLASGRDVTGDGINDLLVGDPLGDAVYLLAGPFVGPVDFAPVSSGVGGSGTQYGLTLALLPDLTDDGIDDIAVAAPGISGGGRVFVFAGGPAPVLDAADALMTLRGDEFGFGSSVVGLDDLDGDGLPEIAVGSPWDGSGFDQTGLVAIFSGLTEGTVTQSAAWSTYTGETGSWGIGYSLTALDDLDGDGVPDLVITGVVQNPVETHSAAWIWSPVAGDLAASDAIARLTGAPTLNDSAEFLRAADVGDLNGDGTRAVALGYPSSPSEAEVAVWDPDTFPAGDLELNDAEARITGLATDDGFLWPQAATVGDLDADGYDDLLVTEPAHDTNTGALYVLLGGPGL